MSERASFLPAAARICKYSGLNLLSKPKYGGLGMILMFHRFTNHPATRVDYRSVVSGQFFDRLVGHIKKAGPRIIALRDVPQAILAGDNFVCLTIDDGYRDNMEIALPILRRHDVPATIFVPSGVLDRTLDAWWLQVEEKAKDHANPQAYYKRKIFDFMYSEELLERARKFFPEKQADLNDKYFMSRSEIRAIAEDSLVDIGGHTVTHPLLKMMPEERAWEEIAKNKEDLEILLGRSVETFAYPFGNAQACGNREFMLVKKAGYKVAVTTRDGNIFPWHQMNMMALPRFSIPGQSEIVDLYDMQKSGMYHLLKSGFRPAPVTE